MAVSQHKTKSRPYKRCWLHNARNRYNHLLGWINYLSNFSARISELTEPIRDLCKEKVPFIWEQEHDGAFQLIKKEIATAPILAYYNPKKPTILQTDASCKGLGACLLQNQKPVYFTSKALSGTQKDYVAIEPESLTVAWVMEKFHHFLYGNKFVLENGSKILRSDTFKESESSNTQVTMDPYKNISLPLQGQVYPRSNKPCGRLST